MTRLPILVLTLLFFASPAVAQRIYWGQQDGLWRASLDGSDAQLLVEADTPQQLGIDRTRAHLYYSRFFLPISHIDRIGLRNLEHEVLWSSETIGQSFALDPLNQEIYFTADDSSVWRLNFETLARERVRPPNFVSGISLAPASRTLYWTLTNDVLKQHSLSRRELDDGDSQTLFFTQILLPPYRNFGQVVLDPFGDRLFAASYLVYYNGYPQELFRPGLDVFDLATADFPRRTFHDLEDDHAVHLGNDRIYGLALDPVREQLYVLFKAADEVLGSIYRFDLPGCLQSPTCEPDVLPVHPTVFDGISLAVDPCGVDEHPAIGDVSAFTVCMTGPAPDADIGRMCYCSDFNEDLRTDLRDLAFLQILFFDSPGGQSFSAIRP